MVEGTRSNLWWIRDCWSLFVSNLPLDVSSKELYGLFREAGFVFDVFVPKNKVSGSSRGFGFVRFKIEWDTTKAINLLHGQLVVSKWISVQMVS